MNEIAKQIWLWAIDHNIWLPAEHLPVSLNVVADGASRKQYANEAEWQLDPQVFQAVEKQFGPFQIDLFATRINTHCKKYFAWKPDPHALAIDAFAQIWDHNIMYGFPPFSMIGRTLQKVEEDRARVVLILPMWSTQHWFGRLLRLLIAKPHRLLDHASCIYHSVQEDSTPFSGN